MKYSVVNSNEVFKNFDMRIDADYFHPNFLISDKYINNNISKEFSIISTIKGGKRLPLGETFSIEGIPYIRAEDIKGFVEYKYSPHISLNIHKELINYQVKYNDVLLTIVGNSVGDVGIVKFNIEKCNLTENCVKIIGNKNVLQEYLYVFLLSKYGQNQVNREKVGTAQPKLAIVRIRKFKMPLLNFNFQNIIKKIIDNSYQCYSLSQDLSVQSEELLLKELGLLNWQPKHKLYSIKKYSEVEQANRIDAEYFQPKYDEIIDKIKNYPNGFYNFVEVVNINDKNVEPKEDIEYKYIELANISKNGEITGSTNDLGKNLPTRARRVVKTNDLIVSSIEGSLDSIALITEEYNKSFCSNGFYVLNSTIYNSETLLCLLKIIIGQLQLKRGCSGTILTAISKEELNKILLPKISDKLQNQIKLNIQDMYKYKIQSKQLLEIAKRGVEIAIEENEDVATNWMNAELTKLKINL